MMRPLVSVLSCVLLALAGPAFAEEADGPSLVARVKVMASPGGQKLFRCQSLGSTKTLLCHAVVSWVDFQSGVHGAGLKLHEAGQKSLVTPALPADCGLTDFTGDLSPDPQAPNALTFQLQGESCIKMGGVILSRGVTIDFLNVPSVNGSQTHASVRLELQPESLERIRCLKDEDCPPGFYCRSTGTGIGVCRE